METPSYNTMRVNLRRIDGDFHFEALGGDPVPVHIDAAAGIGGTHQGARPMELILMGLGSCAAIDVVLILKKMKQIVTDFRIEVEGDREVGATPAPFVTMRVRYILRGENLDRKKVEQAVKLSMDKYCSVSVMLEKTAKIEWVVDIE